MQGYDTALRSFALLLGIVAAGNAWAQERPASAEPAWKISLGVGAAYKPDYEGSNDYEVAPLPDINISYRDLVFLRGPSLGANLVTVNGARESDKLQLGPLVRYRFGRDQDDNDALRGLGDVDGSVEAGLFGRYSVGRWSAGLTVVQDVADGHGGALAEASFGYAMPVASDLKASLRASTTWASEDYMESYFGISGSQAARSGRRPFDAGSGFKDVGLSLGLEYAVTDNWSLGGRVGYTRLLGDAADSPIVDEDGSADQFIVGVSLGYRF